MSIRNRGFSLIELLVVIGLIVVLIAILLPSLAMARRQSRLTTCGMNLRQIHTSLTTYAVDYNYQIPTGPNVPIFFMPTTTWAQMGTKLIWIPYAGGVMNIPSPGAPNTLGLLIPGGYFSSLQCLFCPADITTSPQTNMALYANSDLNTPALCSYLNRQLEQTSGAQRFDDMGLDQAGIRATALAFDQMTNGFGGEWIDNHGQFATNVLYLDAHVTQQSNVNDALVFRVADGTDPSPFAMFPNVLKRLDQILVNADYALVGDISQAPVLP